VSTVSRTAPYHHGDLRAACLDAGLEMLDAGQEADLSLRAVARAIGVSANAPYRHFNDKEALLSALATAGFVELRKRLLRADASSAPGRQFVEMARIYVHYAQEHPGLFRLMFGHPCSRAHPDTVAAAARAEEVLAARVAQVVDDGSREPFIIGCWSIVHGLAALILDGKLPTEAQSIDALVESVISITLAPYVSGG
jgi:AcrR family transcriptional regulator